MSDDESRDLLASEEYEAVFAKVMSGTELAALTQDERDLVASARELTGTPPPGLPMPSRHDPTRRDA